MVDCEFANFLIVEGGQLKERTGSTVGLDGVRIRKRDFLILDGSVASETVRTGQLYNFEDIRSTKFYNKEIHDDFRGTGNRVTSILCAPVRSYDEEKNETKVIGVMQLVNKRDGSFTDRDEDVVASISSHLSTYLDTMSGKEHTFETQLSKLETSLKTRGVRINTAQNQRVELAYNTLMKDLSKAFGAAATSLLVPDEKGVLQLKVSDRIEDYHESKNQLRPAKSIVGKALADGMTVVVNDLPNSPYYSPERHDNYMGSGIKVQSVMVAPCLSLAGETLGVLSVMRDSKSPFSPDDVRVLNSVAGTVAINLEGAGASLSRVLQQVKRQMASTQRSEMFDCSAEVAQVVQSALLLVQKGGGHIDRGKLSELVTTNADLLIGDHKR
jgi:adenylate cyclase